MLDKLDRIPALDGLRAIAALMVMTFHFVGWHGEPMIVRKLAVVGQTGVDLFFVLSGFLITRILLVSRGSPRYFSTFYIRRALRIFPLYFAFLVAFFFLLPWIEQKPWVPFSSQVWSWLYLQNVPETFPSLGRGGPVHFWSLAVEEHFYLVWPLIVLVSPVPRLWKILIAIILVSPILRYAFAVNDVSVFYLTLFRADGLAMGAALAVLVLSRPRVAPMWFAGGAALIASCLAPAFLVLSGTGDPALQAVKHSLIPAFYFCCLGFCIYSDRNALVPRLLSDPRLGFIGAISYGLYVFHVSVFGLVHNIVAPQTLIAELLLSFGGTIAVAWLSFRYFERPITRLNRYFEYGRGYSPGLSPDESRMSAESAR